MVGSVDPWRARGAALVESARSSLWLVPSGLMLAALAGSVATIAIDRVAGDTLSEMWWGFRIGPEGTRAALATVAGSVMTVAGVAFSITIVVLQLASSQYTARIIRSFRRDRRIQLVLGLYTSTFIYALLVLRTISAGEDGAEFTAPVSVTVALALAVGACSRWSR